MAKTTEYIELNTGSFPYGGNMVVSTDENNTQVFVSCEPAWQQACTVKITLQRPNQNEAWVAVSETRQGDIWNDFMSKQPYHAQFNNVAKTGQAIRARIYMYDPWGGGQYMQDDSSAVWIR